MKMLNKLALFVMVLLLSVVSIPATQVSAATSDPAGTKQQLRRVVTESAINYYYATEDGEEFLVYCFNSSLEWPRVPSEGVYETVIDGDTIEYTPDDFNHLSDSVKEKIYKIFYAGYPHNNAGLYAELTDLTITPEMISEALELKDELKTYFPELEHVTLTYLGNGTGTIENYETPEAQVFMDSCGRLFMWGLWGTAAEQEVANEIHKKYPEFDALAKAYISIDDVSELPNKYGEYLYSDGYFVSKNDAHLATQAAIWIVLKKEGISNNDKDLSYFISEYPLIERLVDFAYGSDPIPPRSETFSDMIPYATSFNNGEHLLNSNGTPVKAAGGIKFFKNPFDGMYYSEELHFSQDTDHKTYMSPFEISVMNGSTELSKIITHGKDAFVLVSETLPSGASVKLQSTNYWPSPIYQYVATSDLDKENKQFQEMSGVYYKPVELGFEVNAYAENGNLTIKKQVSGSHTAEGENFWFDANIAIKDANGQQLSGELIYKKYDINTDGSIITESERTGRVYNFGYTGGNNTKFSLKANEAIVFPDLPYGTTYSITEYALKEKVEPSDTTPLGGWTPSYKTNGVVGKNDGKLTKDDANTIEVTNTYTYEPVTVEIKGNKTLKNKDSGSYLPFDESAFSFIMWPDVHGNPMPTGSALNPRTGLVEKVVPTGASNTEKVGIFDFGEINFDQPGEYSYTIEEQQVTDYDISRDPGHYHMTVKVEPESGILNKTVSFVKHNPDHSIDAAGDTSTVSFENIYSAIEIDKEIRVKKSIKNITSDANVSRANFVFKITPKPTEGQTTDIFPSFGDTGLKTCEIKTGDSGEATTPVLKFTNTWFSDNVKTGENSIILNYDISEIDTGVKGIVNYDPQKAKAIITVHRSVIETSPGVEEVRYYADVVYTYNAYNAMGTLELNENVSVPPVFTNTYKSTGELDISVDKEVASLLEYKPTYGDLYQVTINDDFERNGDKTGYSFPEGKTIDLTYNGTNFVASKNKVLFENEGNYRFELSEVIPPTPATGITYDTNKWIVDVNVKDVGTGVFDISVEYYSEKPVAETITTAKFINTYTSQVTVPVKLSKELIGRHLNTTDNFSVVIEHCEGDGIDPLDKANVSTSHINLLHPLLIPLDKANSYSEIVAHAATIRKAGTYFVTFRENVPAATTMSYDTSIYVMKVVVKQTTDTSGEKTLQIADGYPEYYKATDASSWDTAEILTSNEFVFTNKVTSLTIKKETNGMDPSLVYGFDVTFTDGSDVPLANKLIEAYIAGNHTTISTDSSGKTYIELAKDQAAVITDLPNGTKYTIEEVATPSCDTEITVSEDGTETSKKTGKTISDELVAGVKEEVLVVNTAKKPDDKPEYPKVVDTGDNSRTGAYMALAGLSAIGVALVSLTINKLEKN